MTYCVCLDWSMFLESDRTHRFCNIYCSYHLMNACVFYQWNRIFLLSFISSFDAKKNVLMV